MRVLERCARNASPLTGYVALEGGHGPRGRHLAYEAFAQEWGGSGVNTTTSTKPR